MLGDRVGMYADACRVHFHRRCGWWCVGFTNNEPGLVHNVDGSPDGE